MNFPPRLEEGEQAYQAAAHDAVGRNGGPEAASISTSVCSSCSQRITTDAVVLVVDHEQPFVVIFDPSSISGSFSEIPAAPHGRRSWLPTYFSTSIEPEFMLAGTLAVHEKIFDDIVSPKCKQHFGEALAGEDLFGALQACRQA